MSAAEMWFKSVDSQQVVGRFVDVPRVHAAKSREANREIIEYVPALESKVAGSHDKSFQVVKAFNAEQLKARFPGAWDHYQSAKARQDSLEAAAGSGPPVVSHAALQPGETPLSELDFISRDKQEWLRMQGFSTAQQIAGLSDAQCDNLGFGTRGWRKKANQYLAHKTKV